ncbi:MAG: hypothetical protein QOK28_208 [Actinomycetota bacterium]
MNKFLGYRVRAAAVVALAVADGAPLTLTELAAALAAMGIPLGRAPHKTLSDALRWEVRKGRVHRAGRGKYKAGRVPRTTLIYMRERVAAYAAGDTVPRRQQRSDAAAGANDDLE